MSHGLSYISRSKDIRITVSVLLFFVVQLYMLYSVFCFKSVIFIDCVLRSHIHRFPCIVVRKFCPYLSNYCLSVLQRQEIAPHSPMMPTNSRINLQMWFGTRCRVCRSPALQTESCWLQEAVELRVEPQASCGSVVVGLPSKIESNWLVWLAYLPLFYHHMSSTKCPWKSRNLQNEF